METHTQTASAVAAMVAQHDSMTQHDRKEYRPLVTKATRINVAMSQHNGISTSATFNHTTTSPFYVKERGQENKNKFTVGASVILRSSIPCLLFFFIYGKN